MANMLQFTATDANGNEHEYILTPFLGDMSFKMVSIFIQMGAPKLIEGFLEVMKEEARKEATDGRNGVGIVNDSKGLASRTSGFGLGRNERRSDEIGERETGQRSGSVFERNLSRPSRLGLDQTGTDYNEAERQRSEAEEERQEESNTDIDNANSSGNDSSENLDKIISYVHQLDIINWLMDSAYRLDNIKFRGVKLGLEGLFKLLIVGTMRDGKRIDEKHFDIIFQRNTFEAYQVAEKVIEYNDFLSQLLMYIQRRMS